MVKKAPNKNSKKKTKMSTAEKRMLQNEKKRLVAKSFKSYLRTVIRSFEKAVKDKDAALSQQRLQDVFSVADKSVKRGIFKQNKASRLKSRFSFKSNALAIAA